MTIFRQGRWLSGSVFSRSSSLFAATAVLGTGLLVTPVAGAIPHSHARRTLPTALHTARVVDTGAGPGAKRARGSKDPKESKGKAKSKAGARSTGATADPAAASRQAGKKGKGRRNKTEPVDDAVPMFRANRGRSSRGHEVSSGRHGAARREWFADAPAPLVSSGRHGSHPSYSVAAAHTHAGRHDESAVAFARSSRATLPLAHERSISKRQRPVVRAESRPEVLADGVSRPEDDEPMARGSVNGASAGTAQAPAPIVRASAAPSISPAPTPAAQPAIVQGFGGEIAVPSSNDADRPGGTRRRNHPSTWTPQSLVPQPEPLEEREAITQAAVSPAVIPEIYDRNGRLLMPAPLKGSHDVLVHQNLMGNSDGLERIQDDGDLDRLRAAHLLVGFPVNESLRLNEDLPANRRVARPWVVSFAADMARGFYARFRQPLQVNSAVRTVHYQAHLQMVNGNAAATYGEAASPHLTGQAIDIGKRGMSHAELAWMRDYLMPLMQSGKIDVEEEFQQACFHISVYRSYAAGRPTIRHEVAQVRPVVSSSAGMAEAASPDEQ